MPKLYLIRRNLETFTGPMSLVEIREAYKRMQFGLQDEVAGHCGPWIAFDQVEKIRKHYPELVKVVTDDMLQGWGVSEPGKRNVEGDTQKNDAKRQRRSISLALAFLIIALAAFAAAIYLAQAPKMSSKAGTEVKVDELQALFDRGDQAGFNAMLEAHADELLDAIVRSKKVELLPYVRAYAYGAEGQFPGLDPKILRGNASAAAPVDCSLKAWRMRWQQSPKNWSDFISQRRFVRTHWARILAWDPHWIKRRDNHGWLAAQSYYGLCLVMANKGLADLSPELMTTLAEGEKNALAKMRSRLAWLVDMTQKGQSLAPGGPVSDSSLSLWTCFEGARDLASLSKCREGQRTDQDSWQAYVDERYGWSLLRLALQGKGPPPADVATLLVQFGQKMNKDDHFTRFDYRAETKLLRSLAKGNAAPTPIEKAIEKTQNEFPDVKLSH